MDPDQKEEILDNLEASAEEIYFQALQDGLILRAAPPPDIATETQRCRQLGCTDDEIRQTLITAEANASRRFRCLRVQHE